MKPAGDNKAIYCEESQHKLEQISNTCTALLGTIKNIINNTGTDPEITKPVPAKQNLLGMVSQVSSPHARVLIVDDVTTNLFIATDLMKPYHMHIDCVTNGFEAIEAIQDEKVRYDAIFMDHMMPGMDGIETTKKIRELGTDYAKSIPIIALTASTTYGNEEMFLKNGFQAFISKPIDMKRLDSVLREWVLDKENIKIYVREDKEVYSAQVKNDAINKILLNTSVPGLNIEKGITRFNGDSETYLNVLKSYVKSTPSLLDTATQLSKDMNQLADYETIVHGIKGSSFAIFAEEAGGIAKELESAAKAGDHKYIKSKTDGFVKTSETLIAGIGKLLHELESKRTKVKKPEPDKEILEKLRKACLKYKMTIVDKLMPELEACDYEKDGDLIEWLRKNVEQSNFEEIAERLSALDN